MPYHVEWHKEPHIVYVKLSGKMTPEDVTGFGAELIELTRHVPEVKVHTLIDVTEIESIPPINSIVQEVRKVLAAYPNRDMSAMYGASTLVRFLAETLLKLTPLRIKLLDTKEEAEAFILQMVALEEQTSKGPDA